MYPIKIKAHETNLTVVRFNYDGDLFFTAERDRVINVFASFTGELLGSYHTKVSVKTLDVDLNSKYLVYGSFDGTLQIFNVMNGNKILNVNFPYCKIYHLEFDISSKKLLVLHEFEMCSHIKIIDFEKMIALAQKNSNKESKQVDVNQVVLLNNFSLKQEDGVKVISQKARWYADNESIFLGTNTGKVMHYSEKGNLIKKAMVHKGVKIKSVAFSNDFSILATAAGDGCKILDPQTLEIIRFFKQQYQMNDVSISPLFSHPITPKHHLIMAGGIDAKQAAMSKGAGFDIHLCNLMYGNQIGTLLTDYAPISSLQFYKDGLGYVSVADNGQITIVRFQQDYLTNEIYE